MVFDGDAMTIDFFPEGEEEGEPRSTIAFSRVG
ncbi:hypothetical protein DFP74_3721 [Nocardiopsis sp. Huas11]|nr:hypothetical protein DFP74_3721 [Nocardiopsis sp. Huas11]